MGAPRILVVDDSEMVLAMTRDHLEEAGLQVSTVSSAFQIMRVLKEAKADLVILDVTMPGFDGGAVATMIRELNSKAKIIFYSSLADEELTAMVKKFKANGYIRKTGDFKALVRYIGEILVD